MASYKITIEKVDDGAKENGSFVPFTLTQAPIQPDILPVEVILQDNATTGLSLDTLKKFLTLAKLGFIYQTVAVTTLDTGEAIQEAMSDYVP